MTDQSSDSSFNHNSRSRSRDRNKKKKTQKKSKGYSQSTGQIVIKIPTLDKVLVSYENFIHSQVNLINQDFDIDPDKAKFHYQSYKKKWMRKQDEIFFYQHYDDSWFQQKYSPIFFQQNQEQKYRQIKLNSQKFLSNLANGKYNKITWAVSEQVLLNQQTLSSIQSKDFDQQDHNQQQITLRNQINIEEAPFFGFDPDYLTIFIRPIKTTAKKLAKASLKEYMQKLPGFVSLSMSEPLKKQEFIRYLRLNRYCWVNFDCQQNLNRALKLLSTLMIDGSTFSVCKSMSNRRKVRVIRMYPSERLQADIKLTQQLIGWLDKKYGIQSFDLQKLQFSISQKLDIQLLYLRRVFAYEYYLGQLFNDQRTLVTKCGLVHLRIQDNGPDYGIPSFLNKAETDCQKFIQQLKQFQPKFSLQSLLIEQNSSLTQQKNKKEGCLCINCNKKFPGPRVLHLHVQNKHQQAKQKVCRCMICQKRFVDPRFLIKHFQTKHHQNRSFKCAHCKEKLNNEEEFLAHIKQKHPEQQMLVVRRLTFQKYLQDRNKISNYMNESSLQNNYQIPRRRRKPQRRRRQGYNDLDQPQQSTSQPITKGSVVNYLDI